MATMSVEFNVPVAVTIGDAVKRDHLGNKNLQTDQVYYKVCLVKTDSCSVLADDYIDAITAECRVTFFRSEWRMENNIAPHQDLPGDNYFYQTDDDTYRTVFADDIIRYDKSKCNKTIITNSDVQQYSNCLKQEQTAKDAIVKTETLSFEDTVLNYKQDQKYKPRLFWNKCADSEAPKALVHLVEQQFCTDGLKLFQRTPNALGMIDEKTVKEGISSHSTPVSVINNKRLFMSVEDLKVLNDSKVPCLLGTEAHVAHLQDLALWRIDKIYRQQYANPDKQTFDTTWLSKLGQPRNSKTYTLISHKWIVEHCAIYAEELTKAIVDKLLTCELHVIRDKARAHISNNLHNFTYGGTFNRRNFSTFFELLKMPWLNFLMHGGDDQDRREFYQKIAKNSPLQTIKDLCSGLATAIGCDGEKASSKNLITALEQTNTPVEEKTDYILTFNYFGKDILVGISSDQLRSVAADGDIPLLDVRELNPVLLKTALDDNKYLGMFYKRVAIVKVQVKEYQVDDGVPLRIATFVRDVIEADVCDYDNGLLSNILHSRTPFHERRLLQLIGIPCRQALGDTYHVRMKNGLLPLHLPNADAIGEFQTRDNAVLSMAQNFIALQTNLANIHKPDSLQDYIQAGIAENRQYNLLEKTAILQKIASFQELLANTEFDNFVEKFRIELMEQGHFLAAALCETVLEYSGKSCNTNEDKENTRILWVSTFWKVIASCFPDSGPAWASFRERAFEKARSNFIRGHETEDQSNIKISTYSQFVLSAVFDRQVTTFYEPFGRYAMPYEPMVWAVNSVHRLQMLSALLPMCCGDWACDRKYDNDKSRRLVWNYRIAASTKKGLPPRMSGGQVPPAITEKSYRCTNSSCRHATENAALWAIGKRVGFDETFVSRILQQMGWWLNGVLDENLHHHFRCRKCQGILSPALKKDSTNWFRCRLGCEDEGKTEFYLSWCVQPFCSEVVDSRINKNTCAKGKFVCTCESCCPEHQKKHPYTEAEIDSKIWLPACHACFRSLNEAWEAIKNGAIVPEGTMFRCSCGVHNQLYASEKAYWSRKEHDESINAAIQWSSMNQYFEYNRRPVH